MRSIICALFLMCSLNSEGQLSDNNDGIGIQFSGSMLLFNDCCFSTLKHSDPDLELGYRIAILSRHSSGNRFYHDFQLSYSRERLGYTKDRKNVIEDQYIDYAAFHFTYYLGIQPIKKIPLKFFVGHNIGQITRNFGSEVEWELFGLNTKLVLTAEMSDLYYLEPMIEYAWTYNKTTSYNHRLVVGLNFIRKI